MEAGAHTLYLSRSLGALFPQLPLKVGHLGVRHISEGGGAGGMVAESHRTIKSSGSGSSTINVDHDG